MYFYLGFLIATCNGKRTEEREGKGRKGKYMVFLEGRG